MNNESMDYLIKIVQIQFDCIYDHEDETHLYFKANSNGHEIKVRKKPTWVAHKLNDKKEGVNDKKN